MKSEERRRSERQGNRGAALTRSSSPHSHHSSLASGSVVSSLPPSATSESSEDGRRSDGGWRTNRESEKRSDGEARFGHGHTASHTASLPHPTHNPVSHPTPLPTVVSLGGGMSRAQGGDMTTRRGTRGRSYSLLSRPLSPRSLTVSSPPFTHLITRGAVRP